MDINEYFANAKKFKNKIIVIAVKDEASKYAKNFTSAEKLNLKLKLGYRSSYVGVVDFRRDFLYEETSEAKIECSYKVNDSYIDIVSAGFNSGNTSSIKVDGEEYSFCKSGLNIAVFNARSLKLSDAFWCNTHSSGALTVERE